MSADTFRIVATIGLVLCLFALYQIARHLESIEEMIRERWFPPEDEIDHEIEIDKLRTKYETKR